MSAADIAAHLHLAHVDVPAADELHLTQVNVPAHSIVPVTVPSAAATELQLQQVDVPAAAAHATRSPQQATAAAAARLAAQIAAQSAAIVRSSVATANARAAHAAAESGPTPAPRLFVPSWTVHHEKQAATPTPASYRARVIANEHALNVASVPIVSVRLPTEAPAPTTAAPAPTTSAPELHFTQVNVPTEAPELHLTKVDVPTEAPELHLTKVDVPTAAPELHLTKVDVPTAAPELHLTQVDVPTQVTKVNVPTQVTKVNVPAKIHKVTVPQPKSPARRSHAAGSSLLEVDSEMLEAPSSQCMLLTDELAAELAEFRARTGSKASSADAAVAEMRRVLAKAEKQLAALRVASAATAHAVAVDVAKIEAASAKLARSMRRELDLKNLVLLAQLPADCEVGAWSAYPTTCDCSGQVSRTRAVTVPASKDGGQCPALVEYKACAKPKSCTAAQTTTATKTLTHTKEKQALSGAFGTAAQKTAMVRGVHAVEIGHRAAHPVEVAGTESESTVAAQTQAPTKQAPKTQAPKTQAPKKHVPTKQAPAKKHASAKHASGKHVAAKTQPTAAAKKTQPKHVAAWHVKATAAKPKTATHAHK